MAPSPCARARRAGGRGRKVGDASSGELGLGHCLQDRRGEGGEKMRRPSGMGGKGGRERERESERGERERESERQGKRE